MIKKITQLIKFWFNQKRYFDDRIFSWEEAQNNSTGYSSEVILQNVHIAFLKSQKKVGTYERDSVVIDDGIINWPFVSLIYWFMHNYSKELRILDFGGSLASQYFQNKKFLDINDLKWLIVEQENYVRIGKEAVKNDAISFYTSLTDCLNTQIPNFAFFGSSLQYLEKPYEVLNLLNYEELKVIILDRIPTHNNSEDIVVVQNVPKSIYNASYPAWIFSEEKLINFLSTNFQLLTVYESIGGRQQTKKGLNFTWKGFIYIRK